MRFEVRWTVAAAADLEDIVEWIAGRDSPARAEHVLARIEAAVNALESHPERGSYPAELLELGLRDYRETSFKPYRIIYRVLGRQVFLYLVADGRRDMETLLARRLLAVETYSGERVAEFDASEAELDKVLGRREKRRR
jgi:toxin ParE1/3/4